MWVDVQTRKNATFEAGGRVLGAVCQERWWTKNDEMVEKRANGHKANVSADSIWNVNHRGRLWVPRTEKPRLYPFQDNRSLMVCPRYPPLTITEMAAINCTKWDIWSAIFTEFSPRLTCYEACPHLDTKQCARKQFPYVAILCQSGGFLNRWLYTNHREARAKRSRGRRPASPLTLRPDVLRTPGCITGAKFFLI